MGTINFLENGYYLLSGQFLCMVLNEHIHGHPPSQLQLRVCNVNHLLAQEAINTAREMVFLYGIFTVGFIKTGGDKYQCRFVHYCRFMLPTGGYSLLPMPVRVSNRQ